jgi:hypothetical protein
MTSLDRIVTTDLAALAADSRRLVPALDDMLREASEGALRRRQRAVLRGELALLSFANVFAHRVGRAAAGAMGLLCALVLLIVLYGPGVDRVTGFNPWWWVLERETVPITVTVAALVLATYAVSVSLARRRFERAVRARDPQPAHVPEVARLVGAADGWSVGFAIAGVTSVVMVVAVATLVVGWDNWNPFWCFGCDPREALFDDRRRDLGVLLAAVVAAALALGAACARPRWAGWLRAFEHRLVVPAGLVLGSVAVYAWATLDVGPIGWDAQDEIPSSALRTALAVAGTLAIFLVSAGGALWWRRRERDRLEAWAEAARTPVAEQVVSLATVYRQRVARIAGGAVAVGYAVALLVILHHPLGAAANRYTDDSVFRWREWFVYGRLNRVTLVALVVLIAHVLASKLAGRAFERALGEARLSLDVVELARRRVRRLDAWSIAIGIAGIASVASVFAMIKMTVGDSLWAFTQIHGPRSGSAVNHALHDIVAACMLAVLAGLAVGNACGCEARSRRARWLRALEHRATLPAGLMLGLVAVLISTTVDFGVFDISLPAVKRPTVFVETSLIVMCVAAAVLVAAGYTLRRRRAEQQRLGLPG